MKSAKEKRSVGRPPISIPGGRKEKVISVRVPIEDYLRLDNKARQVGRKRADIIRDIIKSGLKE